MSLGKAHHGAGDNMHGAQLFPFGSGIGIVQEIQCVQAVLDILLKVEHAFAIDLIVEDGMTRRALLHEFGEDAGLVSRLPFRGHFLEDQVTHRSAGGTTVDQKGMMVSSYILAGLRADLERDLLARVENIEVLQAVTA